MDWGRLFFSPYGRIGRQDFWVTFLITLGAMVLLGWLFPLFFVALYCGICTRTKRLHDMGRSGWFQIVPLVTYIVAGMVTFGFVMGMIFGSMWGPAAVPGAVVGGLSVGFVWCMALLVDLGFLLWIGCSEGEYDENRFGPSPIPYGATPVAGA